MLFRVKCFRRIKLWYSYLNKVVIVDIIVEKKFNNKLIVFSISVCIFWIVW